jgi:drug/metabolite transporter (DMT)-like permease
MAIVLAIASAIAYGAADFTGGVVTRRAHVFTVVLLSQAVSFALVLGAAPFWAGALSGQAVQWGGAAGVAGLTGAALLYKGLAIGRMSMVAPITGLLSAGIPVLFGIAMGERPGLRALAGVVLGLIAVVMISSAAEGGPRAATATLSTSAHAAGNPKSGLVEALGAGLGFGLFFIFLERAPSGSGLWPLVASRVSMVGAALLISMVVRAPMPAARKTGLQLAWLGLLNVGADLLFLLATRRGLLSLVAVITSMYPASTIILARLVLRERLGRRQLLGLATAAVAVVLIALG